ncbi:ERF family protein [Sorangium sp. So ce1182]|uniref:ERF family protein n=1 Tax=Sorangium sp. So ce1182 TaxID=3133334 RepID=UPI003F5E7E82
MESNEAWPPKLAAALVSARRDVRALPKDGTNDHHRYDYTRAETIIDEGRLVLSHAGLVFSQTAAALDARAGTDGKQVPIYRCTYVLCHESGESRSWVREWPIVESKGRPLDKSGGGALTTAYSYAIRDLLGLPRDDELAAMDRRDDRDHDPGRTADRDDRAPERSDAHAPSSSQEQPKSDDPYNVILEAIRSGASGSEAERQIAASQLPEDSRNSLRLVLRAYRARDTTEFGQVGADIRASDMPRPWIEHTLSVIRPAWDALQRKAAA